VPHQSGEVGRRDIVEHTRVQHCLPNRRVSQLSLLHVNSSRRQLCLEKAGHCAPSEALVFVPQAAVLRGSGHEGEVEVLVRPQLLLSLLGLDSQVDPHRAPELVNMLQQESMWN
jgi:hypothetical protein